MEKIHKKIYINAIKQISAQLPLAEEWFTNPVFYQNALVRALEPDYKQFFTPIESRRLGKILKRALLVSRQVMHESGVPNPDAIITGTGLGCIESTEIFLDKLVRDGEELLNPTHFMQSTHNTIGSLIAIDTKCHSYNSTYAHKGISFECALQDAFLQLSGNHTRVTPAQTALIGAHDEMTPAYFSLLRKAGYLGKPNQTFGGETAVAMMLSTEKTEKTLCKIESLDLQYLRSPNIAQLNIENIDYVMIGINGVPENDQIYLDNCAKLFPNIPLLHYKHIFGESYTAAAFGVYAAAICLQKGEISEHLQFATSNYHTNKKFNKILCYNHFEGKNHAFTLLSRSS